mmetsp:Transcript_27295/g.57429  ORF Transcript_27295/g.57429 Transcript_27295/m.57429 type:complete len:686 (-) Transcript_27295:46-2103(-)
MPSDTASIYHTNTEDKMLFKAITVGDGDLSFSLALKRAYPQISVAASTLLESRSELCRTYSNATVTSKELLEQWKERVIYGVDATKIEEKITAESEEQKFDIVLFNHPHLGDKALLESEKRHAERHYVLLSHYFYSAKSILKNGGRIHICLCGLQPQTWKIWNAARNAGLQIVAEESTACPVHKWLFRGKASFELADVQPHYPSKRKYRNGKLGSKHFLARYGYRHRRTDGDLFTGSEFEINVERSVNFILEEFPCHPSVTTDTCITSASMCHICKLHFDDPEQLSDHLRHPAVPDPVEPLSPVKRTPKPSSRTPSFKPLTFNEATILAEAQVTRNLDSKRLKWICRQSDFPLSKIFKSKKECTDAIKRGRVYVNQIAVLDDSRIVRENDTVSLVNEYASLHKSTEHVILPDPNGPQDEMMGVRFVKIIPLQKPQGTTLMIAYKPVGMRCFGSFCSNTLEMITKNYTALCRPGETPSCHPVSKLDTGCEGLCALLMGTSKCDNGSLASMKINYYFSVLVHGEPTEQLKQGVYVAVPTNGIRLWKRQRISKEKQHNNKDGNNDLAILSSELDLDGSLFIQCQDTFHYGEGNETISTLTVQSRHDDGRVANIISYSLRKLGYPVVNDRFAKREFAALPRRMRNLLKQKVCICCHSIDIHIEGSITNVQVDAHKRTQCSYWRGIMPLP